MRSRRAHPLLLRLSILILFALFALSSAAREPTPEEAAIIDRVWELRYEIEELLERLPPELRDATKPLSRPATVSESVPAPEPTPPPAPASPPAAPAPAPVSTTEPPPSPPQRAGCASLGVFDTNDDSVLDARDRYWRYLDLWIDRDANGEIGEREIVSTFDQKVEEIAADLDWFESRRVSYGQIRAGTQIVLDLRGDGFGGRDDGILVVDAEALRRGDGPSLLDANGTEIQGTTPLVRDQKIIDADGRPRVLGCP